MKLAMLAVLVMCPPLTSPDSARAFIRGANVPTPLITPWRLTPSTQSQSSNELSSIVWKRLIPALLNSSVTGPNSASTLSAVALNASRSITFSCTPMTSRLSRLASAVSIASWRMSAIATLHPSLSRLRTMPIPTPLAPPVTKAVRPAKSIITSPLPPAGGAGDGPVRKHHRNTPTPGPSR
jgi:hypothetical protein